MTIPIDVMILLALAGPIALAPFIRADWLERATQAMRRTL